MPRTSIRRAMLLFLALAASVFLAGTAFSQVADSLPARQTNSLRAGAWAVQFEMEGDFKLSSFDGTTISIKKHTSARGAWRLGVALNGDISRVRSTTSYGQDPYRQVDGSKIDGNLQSLGLGLTRIIYPRSPSIVNFFYGVGPRLSFGRSQLESNPSVAGPTTIRKERNWVVGLGLVMGVELFPYKSLGLSGEYGSSLVYRWQNGENSSFSSTSGALNEQVSKSSGYSLSNGGLRFGISVYW